MDPPGSVTVIGGPVVAENNVLNQRGGQSLYQICMSLRRRLAEVPGFEQHLIEMEEDDDAEASDPVTSLWRCFRRGYPLMTIYNASNPADGPITVDESRVGESKRGKAATFKFLQSCMQELSIPAEETFLITDLYSDNTTGFVRVSSSICKSRGCSITSFRMCDYAPVLKLTSLQGN